MYIYILHFIPQCFTLIKKYKRHLVVFLIIKTTRCTNFSNLFLEWNSTCFGQFLCPSSEFFAVHTTMVYVIGVYWQLSRKLSANLYVLLRGRWKTPDDGHRNCPKHGDFYSKNKFEKLVHLVGFIVRDLSRCCTVSHMDVRRLVVLSRCQLYVKPLFKSQPDDGFMRTETRSCYVLWVNYI